MNEPVSYYRAWRLKHPGASAEASRKWRKAHPEKAKAQVQRRDKDKVRERYKKWYAKNIEHVRAYSRRPEVKEKAREYQRKKLGLPKPLYPCPEKCEWAGCERKATELEHCHVTGVFRGWLCKSHNLGLGLIGDTAEALMNGIHYLNKGQTIT